MNTSRRELLFNAASLAATAMSAGCVSGGLKLTGGGSMSGFVAPKLKRIRVAMVGLGSRGYWALTRLVEIPGVDIVAVADNNPEVLAKCRKFLAEKKLPAAKEFGGDEGYKAMCDTVPADVLYNCTPRDLHVAMNVYAMDRGLHALTEVPGSMTLDGCWETVEASERNRVHCMMLENCCYGECEMLALNLVRQGLLGEIIRCDGAYIHEQRSLQFKDCPWRLHDTMTRKGNYYPTHGLGPLCKCMNINRGDRFDFLVSMESAAPSFEGYAREVMKGTPLENAKMSRGDVNFTLMKTVKGKLLSLQHDVGSPRPYDRVNLVSGTKGIVRGINPDDFKLTFEEKLGDGAAHEYFSQEKTQALRLKYRHPLWTDFGEFAKKLDGGGHGGMDYIMDLRWAFCLMNGLPLDTDVYDLATWSSIVGLTDKSVRSGSRPVDFPDFTRGGWETSEPFAVGGVDLRKMGV